MNDDLEDRLEELLAERGRVGQDAADRVLSRIHGLPERRAVRRARIPLAAMAAVVAVALVGLALATLLRDQDRTATPISPSPSVASPVASASTAAVTPSATATLQPRPVWAMDLASHLDCDGPLARFGLDVSEHAGPSDVGPTPDEALDVARMIDYPNIPVSGFAPTLVDGHWALHRYLVDGRPKVHVVTTDLFGEIGPGWSVVGLRACDPSEFADAEFGPMANAIWRDSAGDPVRTDIVTSQSGSGHCGWERLVFLLHFDPSYMQYIRDPDGTLEEYMVVPFDADVRLPKDAVDTGFHTDDWHLFTIPSGRAVFMRTSDGTFELWPRAKEPIGCA